MNLSHCDVKYTKSSKKFTWLQDKIHFISRGNCNSRFTRPIHKHREQGITQRRVRRSAIVLVVCEGRRMRIQNKTITMFYLRNLNDFIFDKVNFLNTTFQINNTCSYTYTLKYVSIVTVNPILIDENMKIASSIYQ